MEVAVVRTRRALLGAGLAIFMAMLDSSVVVVALPAIETDLGVPTTTVEWVVLAYTLALACLVVPAGRWLDRVGTRNALVSALLGFLATSLLAAIAPTAALLIAARAAQGCCAAVLFAAVPAIAATVSAPGAQGRTLGVIGAIGPLGAVSGPAVGGLLVGAAGWPTIFLINLPIGAVAIAALVSALPGDGSLRAPRSHELAEAALFGAAVAAVLLGLTFAAEAGPWWGALGLAALPLLIAWNRVSGRHPLVDLLGRGRAGGLLGAMALTTTGGTILQFLAPYFLLRVVQATPGEVGFTVLAFPLAMAAVGPLGGAAADRWGPRRVSVLGAAVLTVALALAVPAASGWGPVDIAWRMALAGLGLGLFIGPNQVAIMAAAGRSRLGVAAAASGLARSLAFSLGPALATAAWALGGYAPAGMRAAFGLACGLGLLAVVLVLVGRGDGNRTGNIRESAPPEGAVIVGTSERDVSEA